MEIQMTRDQIAEMDNWRERTLRDPSLYATPEFWAWVRSVPMPWHEASDSHVTHYINRMNIEHDARIKRLIELHGGNDNGQCNSER